MVCQLFIYLGLLIKLSDETRQISKVFQFIAHFTVKFAFYLPFSVWINLTEPLLNNRNHFCFKGLIDNRGELFCSHYGLWLDFIKIIELFKDIILFTLDNFIHFGGLHNMQAFEFFENSLNFNYFFSWVVKFVLEIRVSL